VLWVPQPPNCADLNTWTSSSPWTKGLGYTLLVNSLGPAHIHTCHTRESTKIKEPHKLNCKEKYKTGQSLTAPHLPPKPFYSDTTKPNSQSPTLQFSLCEHSANSRAGNSTYKEIATRWHLKVPRLLLLLTASVKEDERGGQGHAHTSLLHQSAIRQHPVNTQRFYTSALSTCFVLSGDGWQNWATCLHQVLCEAV
jgi:hypothetical protein